MRCEYINQGIVLPSLEATKMAVKLVNLKQRRPLFCSACEPLWIAYLPCDEELVRDALAREHGESDELGRSSESETFMRVGLHPVGEFLLVRPMTNCFPMSWLSNEIGTVTGAMHTDMFSLLLRLLPGMDLDVSQSLQLDASMEQL